MLIKYEVFPSCDNLQMSYLHNYFYCYNFKHRLNQMFHALRYSLILHLTLTSNYYLYPYPWYFSNELMFHWFSWVFYLYDNSQYSSQISSYLCLWDIWVAILWYYLLSHSSPHLSIAFRIVSPCKVFVLTFISPAIYHMTPDLLMDLF